MKLFDVREALADANSRAPVLKDPAALTAHPLNDFALGQNGWESFVESVKKLGIIHPVLLDCDGRIVSGKRRVAACRELGCKVPVFKIRQKLSKNDTLAIILVANIASRHIEKQAIDKLWDRVYAAYTEERLRSGGTTYEVSKEIAAKSGINMRTTRRHVYRIQNQIILEKYLTLSDLKVDKPARLSTLTRLWRARLP